MTVHKSVELFPKFFVIKILLHSSASSPDGADLHLVLTAAIFTKSASIYWIDCSVVVSVSKTSNSAAFHCGYFCFNWFNVFCFNGRIK